MIGKKEEEKKEILKLTKTAFNNLSILKVVDLLKTKRIFIISYGKDEISMVEVKNVEF